MSRPSNMPVMTFHARQRLTDRFTGLLSFDQVCRTVNTYARQHGFQVGQTYVQVARFENIVCLSDSTCGDVAYAVVDVRSASDAGRICTILVRRSDSTDRTYRQHENIEQQHTVWRTDYD